MKVATAETVETDSTSSSKLSIAKNTACVLDPSLSFSYQERALPRLSDPQHVIVEILATGICGSDIHYWKHGGIGAYRVEKPIVLGHESAGVVVECGEGVKTLQPGDRVALEPGVPCRTCRTCRAGRYNLCPEMRFAATPPVDGTLTTFYSLPEDFCFKLPDGISLEEGALMEPLSVAVHCARLAGIKPGDTVLVLGAGPIGLLCCAVATAFGARKIVVTDIAQGRLQFAETYVGAHPYHVQSTLSYEAQAASILQSAGLRDGVDVCIDATGVEASIQCGVAALARGGVFVQAGLGNAEITYPVGLLSSKEATYRGSYRYGPGDYELSLQLLASGKVSVKPLVTHRYAFEDAQHAFEAAAKHQGIKTIILGPGAAFPSPKL